MRYILLTMLMLCVAILGSAMNVNAAMSKSAQHKLYKTTMKNCLLYTSIRVETTKILVFVAAGCITGLAAFVNAIKVGSVTSTAGNQLETQIMIALVLGGMPVNGGAKVRFYNIILGVMTYKVLSSGLVMLMMPTQLQQLILGIIFLIEVAIFSDRKTCLLYTSRCV